MYVDVAAFADTMAVGLVWWTLGAAFAVFLRRLWASRHPTPT